MRNLLLALIIAFTTWSFFACGEVKVAGGVSEETNTIAGILEDANGNRIANVPVAAHKLAPGAKTIFDTTSLKGHFTFELENGEYAISAIQKENAFYKVLNVEKNIDIKAIAEPLDTFKLSVKYSNDSIAEGVVVTLPGSSISSVVDKDGNLQIALPHGDFAILAESKSEDFDNAYFKVSNGKIYGPYNASENVSATLTRTGDTEVKELTIPKKAKHFALWNFETAVQNKVISNGNVLYIYGSPEIKNGELILNDASQFAVLESDNGEFSDAESFSASLKINILKMPKDSAFRKNILGKVGFGGETDESAFSLALVKGECGTEQAKLAFIVADGKTDFSSDCKNAVFADVHENENAFFAVSFDKGDLRIFKNGLVIGSAKTNASKLRNSRESIYVGKENISMKIANITLSTTSLNDTDAFYESSKEGGL